MSTASVADRLYTFDDLAHLPDDGRRYEIIGGELIVSPAPLVVHQRTVGRLFRRLADHVDEHQLGEVFVAPLDVAFSPFDSVEPDVFYLSSERLHLVHPGSVAGAPDLVIEVFSPSSRRMDLIRKQALYATYGVREYWLVDPVARTVQVLSLRDQRFESVQHGDLIVSRVLPSLRLKMVDIFPPRLSGS